MNEKEMREHYQRVKTALSKLDDERETLQEMAAQAEKWLRLHDAWDGAPQPETPVERPSLSEKGVRSNTDLFVKIVLDEAGRIVHAKEVLKKAEAAGATIGGIKLKVIDGTLSSVAKKPNSPIESLGKRTFRAKRAP